MGWNLGEKLVDILDFFNGLGKKFESFAIKDELKVAKAVRESTDRNPILRRFNSLVDEWRGVLFLLMFIWMLAMAYFIIYYDNGLALRTRAFIGADDACARGPGNPNGYILSNNMTGFCRSQALEPGIYIPHLNITGWDSSCNST